LVLERKKVVLIKSPEANPAQARVRERERKKFIGRWAEVGASGALSVSLMVPDEC